MITLARLSPPTSGRDGSSKMLSQSHRKRHHLAVIGTDVQSQIMVVIPVVAVVQAPQALKGKDPQPLVDVHRLRDRRVKGEVPVRS